MQQLDKFEEKQKPTIREYEDIIKLVTSAINTADEANRAVWLAITVSIISIVIALYSLVHS